MEIKDLPISIAFSCRIEEKCVGCPAMKAQVGVRSDHPNSDLLVGLRCENEEVCNALEERRWASLLPCAPGDALYFMNGQTGRVMEIAFDGNSAPLIRCVKLIGSNPYESCFRADEIGKSVFLSREEHKAKTEVNHEMPIQEA